MTETIMILAAGMSSRMKKSESDELNKSKIDEANKKSKSLISFGNLSLTYNIDEEKK